MTGLYPDQTKSKRLRLYVRQTIPDVITLGQKLKMENYHSVRIGKIYHYHNPRDIGTAGHDDSFTWDRTVNPYGRDKLDEHKIHALKENWDGATLSWLEADGLDSEQTDGIGANETISFLDEFAKSGENFFLAFGLYRPHVPFVTPKAYYDLHKKSDFTIPYYDDGYLKTIPEPAALSIRARKEQINIEKEKARYLKRAYYATTSFVDAQIGKVLDKLKETGLDKNTIIIDTRNNYEYSIGTFKNSLNPNTTKFREFPNWLKKNKFTAHEKNNKNIAMFCTGGIRCEKASSLMKEKGFKNVYHLKGGILKYFESVSKEKSRWQGECFVFDDRVSVKHDLSQGTYDMCHGCRMPITDNDKKSKKYIRGVACPECFDKTSEEQKLRYKSRQKQVDLAKERNQKHIGPKEEVLS